MYIVLSLESSGHGHSPQDRFHRVPCEQHGLTPPGSLALFRAGVSLCLLSPQMPEGTVLPHL